MQNKKKKLAIGGAFAGVALLGAGVAYAALGGTITGTNIIAGTATPGGGSSCQTQSISFQFGDPAWDSGADEFQVTDFLYAGFLSACVTANADLTIVVLSGGTEFYNNTVTPSGSGGNLSLTTPMTVNQVTSATIEYLVTE
jgi:hypothetical protein